jgi:hypothetical protein
VNAHTAQMDDLVLVALPSAVNCAELFVRFALTEWSLRGLLDEATHAARQLVNAAVVNADPRSPGFLTVRLRLEGDRLVIEVDDGRLAWHELPLPTGMSAAAVRLPRREQRRSPAAERLGDEPSEVDPQVIQRIFTALSRSPEQH